MHVIVNSCIFYFTCLFVSMLLMYMYSNALSNRLVLERAQYKYNKLLLLLLLLCVARHGGQRPREKNRIASTRETIRSRWKPLKHMAPVKTTDLPLTARKRLNCPWNQPSRSYAKKDEHCGSDALIKHNQGCTYISVFVKCGKKT